MGVLRMAGGTTRAPSNARLYPAPAAGVSAEIGGVKVKLAPRPGPALSARMRPPWTSTSPLQMARASPMACWVASEFGGNREGYSCLDIGGQEETRMASELNESAFYLMTEPSLPE